MLPITHRCSVFLVKPVPKPSPCDHGSRTRGRTCSTFRPESISTCKFSLFSTHIPTSSGATDTTGFLAVDTTNELIVLSFRGSESVRNYLTDVLFPLVPIDLCTGCLGEAGFWSAWADNRGNILPSVKETVADNPSYTVVVTGHSLGGAIATFAAAELRNGGILVDLVRF